MTQYIGNSGANAWPTICSAKRVAPMATIAYAVIDNAASSGLRYIQVCQAKTHIITALTGSIALLCPIESASVAVARTTLYQRSGIASVGRLRSRCESAVNVMISGRKVKP